MCTPSFFGTVHCRCFAPVVWYRSLRPKSIDLNCPRCLSFRQVTAVLQPNTLSEQSYILPCPISIHHFHLCPRVHNSIDPIQMKTERLVSVTQVRDEDGARWRTFHSHPKPATSSTKQSAPEADRRSLAIYYDFGKNNHFPQAPTTRANTRHSEITFCDKSQFI